MGLITQRTNPDGDAKSNFIAINQALDEIDAERRFEIVKILSGTLTKPSSTAVYGQDIPHGLSYIPTFLAFYTAGSAKSPFPVLVLTSAGLVDAMFTVTSDDTNFYVYVETPNWGLGANYHISLEWTYEIKVLQERIT